MKQLTTYALIITVIVAALSVPFLAGAQQAVTIEGTVTNTGLAVRTAPNTLSSEVIARLGYEAPLTALARNEDTSWLQVRAEDGNRTVDGWVSARFVTLDSNVSALPTVDVEMNGIGTMGVVGVPFINTDDRRVVVRNEPTLGGSDIIGVIGIGESIDVVGRSGNTTWYVVQLDEETRGWVYAPIVNLQNGAATALPVFTVDDLK